MKRTEVIEDLKTLKGFFEKQSGACPLSLEYAIKELLEQPEQRWIPIKTRPMTEEERQEYSEYFGYDIEYDEAVMFECKMPDDGQDVWVCSKCGNVWQDTCVVEEGIGLEGNGDWLDIVAWMLFDKPEPYQEEGEV